MNFELFTPLQTDYIRVLGAQSGTQIGRLKDSLGTRPLLKGSPAPPN